MFPTNVEISLATLAVSDIIHACVVLPTHFKNLSVQNKDFYGGRCTMLPAGHQIHPSENHAYFNHYSATYNLQQTTILNFTVFFFKITNKACHFTRIVCWQTRYYSFLKK